MKKKLTGIVACMFLLTGFSTASAAPADDRDCTDFASNQEVMEFWTNNNYSAANDPHDLDRDKDGLACEVSQSEYDRFLESQESTSNQTIIDESQESTSNQTIIDESQESTSSQTIIDENSSTSDNADTVATSETERGEQLPDTASNALLFTLIGTGLMAAGSLLLYRRKKNHS